MRFAVPRVRGGCGLDRFEHNRFSVGTCGCKSVRVAAKRIVMAAWMLRGGCFARGTKLEHETLRFSVSWLQPAMHRFDRNRFLLGVLQPVDANRIVTCMDGYVLLQAAKRIEMAAVAWGLFWGGSRSTKRCVFCV